ncbi:epoxide hydrolase family protein [Streptomyces sp. NPDC001380]|uniref:epoxide hydrolase family protein n=1 Tax=Streptomyces sp. NPDC001380 TaxID=3364566 RepID=UPI003683A09B
MSKETPQNNPAAGNRHRFSRRGILRTAAIVGAATAAPAALLTANSASADVTTAGAAPVQHLVLPPATEAVQPFHLQVPESALEDLRRRLDQVRLPERETVPDNSQGAQREPVAALLEHWRTRYDWRRLERRLNSLGQYRTEIDGLGIHFLHVRSRHAHARPLLLCHGWPGSVVEFLKAVGPLTDPEAHGGTAADAFHVVIPSMPGYGFSDKPETTGWNTERIARAWVTLMERLGYQQYIVQGGDWGGSVATQVGKLKPAGLAGVHLNLPEFMLTGGLPVDNPTPAEQTAIAQQQKFNQVYAGYFTEQATRPQTVGYALNDSPAGLAAWIYEKFVDWTDSHNHPEQVLTRDEMLDDITLYWLTGTGASSARLYWEFYRSNHELTVLGMPVGVSVFPGELVSTPRVWAERAYSNLRYFNDSIAAGGHFAAFEQPALFAGEIRAFARTLA